MQAPGYANYKRVTPHLDSRMVKLSEWLFVPRGCGYSGAAVVKLTDGRYATLREKQIRFSRSR